MVGGVIYICVCVCVCVCMLVCVVVVVACYYYVAFRFVSLFESKGFVPLIPTLRSTLTTTTTNTVVELSRAERATGS